MELVSKCLSTWSQTTFDLFSLAQPCLAVHQEYKPEKRIVLAFSRVGLQHLRKTRSAYLGLFAGETKMLILISTASSIESLGRCGFGWKAKPQSSDQSFFSHAHHICGLLLHSLCTMNRQHLWLLARYPKLPQATATTTIFI